MSTGPKLSSIPNIELRNQMVFLNTLKPQPNSSHSSTKNLPELKTIRERPSPNPNIELTLEKDLREYRDAMKLS